GTAPSRLARARHTLRLRLERRGIKLSALLAALSVAESAGRAAVPAVLASVTTRFGLLVAAGELAAGSVPSHVAAPATGVTTALLLRKRENTTAVLLVLGIVAAGAGAWGRHALANPAGEAQAEAKRPAVASPAPAAPAAEKDSKVEIRGRVLDPDGKPVRGARLVFVY